MFTVRPCLTLIPRCLSLIPRCLLPLVLVPLASLLLLTGCATQTAPPPRQPLSAESPDIAPLNAPGLFPVSTDEARALSRALSPAAQGLGSWKDMGFAVDQSLAHTRGMEPSRVAFQLGGRSISYGELAAAQAKMKALLPELDQRPECLAEAFTWYRIGPDFGFTGYYEPELAASAVRTQRFRYPVYKRPAELGHYSRKRPFHSRHAIDCKGALAGRGLEIAWVDDPLELFILQIQGSGRLRYQDGSIRYVLYAGKNGHKYVPLGRVLRDRGLIPPDNINMDIIRNCMAQYPDQRADLLASNPSYVFFRLADTPSLGSIGRQITPWVSVATDQRVLPNGCLTFMKVDLPSPEGPRPHYALTLPQDTGGAIRNNRVDLFCGAGSRASRIAGYLDAKGAVFLLLPR